MKKILSLAAVLILCVSSAYAVDVVGSYSIDSVTITPPGGSWSDTEEATLVVGTTYGVEMKMSFDNSDSTYDDIWANNLVATLTFDNSGISYTDDDNAANIGSGSTYDFFYSITATSAMVGDTMVNVSLANGDLDCVPFDFSASLAVNAVPEPSTIILFGAGLVGLVGVSRRKKKA